MDMYVTLHVSYLESFPSCAKTVTSCSVESDLEAVISSHISGSNRELLLALLRKYFTQFGVGSSPLEVAKHVLHAIDTTDARHLRQRPYCVSSPEKQTIDN